MNQSLLNVTTKPQVLILIQAQEHLVVAQCPWSPLLIKCVEDNASKIPRANIIDPHRVYIDWALLFFIFSFSSYCLLFLPLLPFDLLALSSPRIFLFESTLLPHTEYYQQSCCLSRRPFFSVSSFF